MSSQGTPPQQLPPGWYDDEAGATRWWDGAGWTAHTAPGVTHPTANPWSTAPAVAPRRRSRTPWVVGGVVVLALVVASGLGFLLGARPAESTPSGAVRALDQAYADVDCDAYRAVTTSGYREGEDTTSCADFRDLAQGSSEYYPDYRIEVTGEQVTGETATVTTTETYTDADPDTPEDGTQSTRWTYSLVRQDGRWLVADATGDDASTTT